MNGRTFRAVLTLFLLLAGVAGPVLPAENDTPAEYVPITTLDPQIPLDQLRLLVKPLTRQELQGEADAWFELLRRKARQIAAVQLGAKKTTEALMTDDAQLAQEAIDAAGAAERQAREQASEQKEQLLTNVATLQDQRTALTDRLEIVLDSLEQKGGEVDEYRDYIAAVSGFEIDAQDASATWVTITGWLASQEGGRRWAWNFGRFLLILSVSWVVAKIVARITNWLLEHRLALSQLAEDLVSRTIKNVIMVVGFAVALTALEIDITPILAAIGAAGFIVGFALQGTLSNFASGLMILINRPFDVSDIVTAGGVTGTIHQMNLVSTTFRTFDNQTIHVPNNEIWGNIITNITANDKRRVDLEFGIGYDDDFERAEQIIREVVEANELVLDDPEPTILLHELGDSAVKIVCRPWARTSDWWTVKTQITRNVKLRFDEAGITIPYPQTDIHVYQHSKGSGDA